MLGDGRLEAPRSGPGPHGRAKKKYADDARLAYWYGLDPFRLTREQRLGLLLNLPAVQAQRKLFEGLPASMDPREVADLVLLATGSERQAAAAAEQRILAQHEELMQRAKLD